LFLCTDTEVVTTAWDFEAITRAHGTYLKHQVANVPALNRAGDLQGLARVARIERDAYHYAFAVDPLLPRELWPKGYQGALVEERHQAFLARLRTRLKELAAA
jgi:DNA-binding transcriptional regulator PaaX